MKGMDILDRMFLSNQEILIHKRVWCAWCGEEIAPGTIAQHIVPYADVGTGYFHKKPGRPCLTEWRSKQSRRLMRAIRFETNRALDSP